MRILMTGATGLIGRELGKALAARGDTLVCLVRDVAAARRRLPFPAACHAWNHTRPVPAEALHGVDALVNLAGEPAADARWTPAKKALIRDSRVQGTQQLVRAVLAHGQGVRAFVQGSAIGYYGDRGDAPLHGSSTKGPGFLADVVESLEAELGPLAQQRPDLRVPVVRTGIVLACQGGALAEMLPVFRLSAGGRLGNGKQWMSWIHLHDIVRLLMHALDGAPSGILEGVAPQPVTNRQFTAAMCRSLGVIQNLPAPSLAIHAMFGERAAIVLGSARVTPVATQAAGFRCRFETVEQALDDLLASQRGGFRERVWEQWLPHAAEDIWPVSCDAAHLGDITPPFLAFRAVGLSTPVMGAGTLADHRIKVSGIPMAWQTRMDAWEPPRRFVAVQAKGPYSLWHHTHDLLPLGGGTLMRDAVRYRLPAGWLGSVAVGAKVASDLERIFDYRARKLDERFGAGRPDLLRA